MRKRKVEGGGGRWREDESDHNLRMSTCAK